MLCFLIPIFLCVRIVLHVAIVLLDVYSNGIVHVALPTS
jgi:hypothetical protein